MQIHELRPEHYPRRGRQVGRGGKRGKTAGRGTKGQKARAGHKIRPELRDVIKRIPKKRGYRFQSIQPRPQVINLDALERAFGANETVSPETLRAKGLIRRGARIKILGRGRLSKPLAVVGCLVSSAATRRIEVAGGKIGKIPEPR